MGGRERTQAGSAFEPLPERAFVVPHRRCTAAGSPGNAASIGGTAGSAHVVALALSFPAPGELIDRLQLRTTAAPPQFLHTNICSATARTAPMHPVADSASR